MRLLLTTFFLILALAMSYALATRFLPTPDLWLNLFFLSTPQLITVTLGGYVAAYLSWLSKKIGRGITMQIKRKQKKLQDLSWQELEQVCLFMYGQEWKVLQTGTGNKTGSKDGGMDLLLKRQNHLKIVQVKHWKTKIGVKTMRELYGLMIHQKAQSVDVVAPMGITKDAWAFIQGKPIRLIKAKELYQWIHQMPTT